MTSPAMADITLQRHDPSAALGRIAMNAKAGVAIFLLAVLQQTLGHHNADNSWLMEVCERILAGARVYLDIIETNPPASFLIYMAPAMAARVLSVSTELMTHVFVFSGGLASIWFTLRLASQCGVIEPGRRGLFSNAMIFAVLFLPGIAFAQREHIALIAILPAIVVHAARIQGMPTPLRATLAAGALAGIAVCIKPFFILAMALPVLLALWRQRSMAAAFQVENVAAAFVVVCYGALTPLLYPEFVALLPAILDTYASIKAPFPALLARPQMLATLALLAALVLAARSRRFESMPAAMGAASFGFTLAALLQGKGWLNHYLPGAALALIALAMTAAPFISAAASGTTERVNLALRYASLFALVPALFFVPQSFGEHQQFAMKEEYAGLTAAVRRIAPPQPKVMALSADIDVAFPLVRKIGGTWVSQINVMWLMGFAQLQIDAQAGDVQKLKAYIDRDAEMFERNARDGKPDIILVDSGAHIDKMRAHPAIRRALSEYYPVKSVRGIALWIPKTKLPAVASPQTGQSGPEALATGSGADRLTASRAISATTD